MNIVALNKLTEEEKKKIKSMQKMCNEVDGLQDEVCLSDDLNFDKELPCFFIAYEGEEIIGFLSAFMPSKEEAEVSAFTHVNYRRQNCFTELFKKAVEVFKEAGIKNVLFLIEPEGIAGKKVLEKYKCAKWIRSEYRMSCSEKKEYKNFDLEFKPIKEENKEICVKICDNIYDEPEMTSLPYVENVIKSLSREGYIAFLDNEEIGIFNISFEECSVFLYGVGILPKFRGKGYGKQLLFYALNKGFEKCKKMVLDVDSDNPNAYNMYLHNGFKVDFQVDYYKYGI